MCFTSSFFPWYFKSLRLVNHKEEGQKFRNLGCFKNLFFFVLVFYTLTAREPWSKKIKMSSIIIKASFKDVCRFIILKKLFWIFTTPGFFI
jgi:hypothetical protein